MYESRGDVSNVDALPCSTMRPSFITHNFGVVEYLADDIAVMKDGRIVEQGNASTLLTSPRDSYTQALLAAVPRLKRAR